MNRARAAWDRFFHARTDDRLGGALRIAFAAVCGLNLALLGLDLDLFYFESGLVPYDVGRAVIDPDAWTLFSLLPRTDGAVRAAYGLTLLHLLLLGVGVWPRLQAACVFLWLCSFQHRNIVLFDAEDNVFRLLSFFLVFMPLHRYAPFPRLAGRPTEDGTWPLWPFRLVQLQMCLIFTSTVLLKWSAAEWRDGTAMYYVVHADDLYGKVFNPALLFGYMLPLRLITWATLVLESAAPLVIWLPRARRPVLAALVVFHLGVDLSMNLNLFHWVMIVGWSSFLARPVDEDPPANASPAE